MKTGSIFWGAFFIVLGGLFLAKNFGAVNANTETVWKLWPVILISLGASYLMANEPIAKALAGISGALAGVILWTALQKPLSTIVLSAIQAKINAQSTPEQNLYADLDGAATRARLEFFAGAGEFALKDTTAHLVQMNAQTSFGGYEITQARDGETEVVKIEMKDAEIDLNDKLTNKVNLLLNQRLTWDIKMEIGAAKATLDYSRFKVETLDLESGAAVIDLRLSDLADSVVVTLSAAASKMEIQIPKSVGCELSGDLNLTTKIALEDFRKSNDKFQTANFESAPKKIYITLDGGLSKLTLARY
jgi:hypothetical protein